MRIRLHPDAERALESAGDWYDQQRRGLRADLAEQLEHASEAIVERPSTWALWPEIAAQLGLVTDGDDRGPRTDYAPGRRLAHLAQPIVPYSP